VADHVWLLGEIARFAGYGRFESVRRAEQHRKQERMSRECRAATSFSNIDGGTQMGTS